MHYKICKQNSYGKNITRTIEIIFAIYLHNTDRFACFSVVHTNNIHKYKTTERQGRFVPKRKRDWHLDIIGTYNTYLFKF